MVGKEVGWRERDISGVGQPNGSRRSCSEVFGRALILGGNVCYEFIVVLYLLRRQLHYSYDISRGRFKMEVKELLDVDMSLHRY